MRTPWGIALAGLLLAGGCTYQPYVSQKRLDQGLVLVLTGIEGRSRLNQDIARGLDEGGVKGAIEIVDWTASGGSLVTLASEERNRKRAVQLAERIGRYWEAFPGRPVSLVGQSGGGAMAIWTAEAMPEGEKTPLDVAVLIDAAISPDYDVAKAAAHCKRGIVNFYSQRDVFMLGLGTTVAGTMDRKHTASAGQAGFRTSPPGLRQVPWTEEMAKTGHIGLHASSASREFIKEYVAPVVVGGDPRCAMPRPAR